MIIFGSDPEDAKKKWNTRFSRMDFTKDTNALCENISERILNDMGKWLTNGGMTVLTLRQSIIKTVKESITCIL